MCFSSKALLEVSPCLSSLNQELESEFKKMPVSGPLCELGVKVIPYLIIWRNEEKNQDAFQSSESHRYFDYTLEEAFEKANQILVESKEGDSPHGICAAIKQDILKLFSQEEFKPLQKYITEPKHLLWVMMIPWTRSVAFQKKLNSTPKFQRFFSTLEKVKPYHIRLLLERITEKFFLDKHWFTIRAYLIGFFELSFYSIERVKQSERLKNWLFDDDSHFDFADHHLRGERLEEYFKIFQEGSENNFLKNWIFAPTYPELSLEMQIQPFFQLGWSLDPNRYQALKIILKKLDSKTWLTPVSRYFVFDELAEFHFESRHVSALRDPDLSAFIEKFISLDQNPLSIRACVQDFYQLTPLHFKILRYPSIRKIIFNHPDPKNIFGRFFSSVEKRKMESERRHDDLACAFNILIETLSLLLDDQQYDFTNDSPQRNYEKILQDTTGLFDTHLKTVAFFLLSRPRTGSGISSLLKLTQPNSLRNHLQKTLNQGGYNFPLNEEDESISLGVEIEFLGVPNLYRKLLENSMNIIQRGWNHPGDLSVKTDGNEDTYSGESTTPPIKDDRMLHDAMHNVSFLQAMGAQTNNTCGLHVHIGVKTLIIPSDINTQEKKVEETAYQLEFMRQFTLTYQREKDKLDAIERSHNDHASKMEAPPKKIRMASTIMDLTRLTNAENTRCSEINLLAFNQHGTIEIRRFAGTTEEPQIYSILSMIYAMAREAQRRTNHIFRETKLEEKQAIAPESMMPLIQAKKNTEQKVELFRLRVNPLLEYHLQVVNTTTVALRDGAIAPPQGERLELNEVKDIPPKDAHRLGTVYISLDQQGGIQYKTIDREGNEQGTGLIDCPELLHKPSLLNLTEGEKNKILLEIAQRGHAKISHPVSKAKIFFEETARRRQEFDLLSRNRKNTVAILEKYKTAWFLSNDRVENATQLIHKAHSAQSNQELQQAIAQASQKARNADHEINSGRCCWFFNRNRLGSRYQTALEQARLSLS